MKKIKILLITFLIVLLFAMVTSAIFYFKQVHSAIKINELNDELIDLNTELEKSQLRGDSLQLILITDIKQMSSKLPDSAFIQKNTKRIELDGLIQNIFSPIVSKRKSATKILVDNWINDENLMPNLMFFSKDRFGQESFNKAGIINTIFILKHLNMDLLIQNQVEVFEFTDRVFGLEGRPQTKNSARELEEKMNNAIGR